MGRRRGILFGPIIRLIIRGASFFRSARASVCGLSGLLANEIYQVESEIRGVQNSVKVRSTNFSLVSLFVCLFVCFCKQFKAIAAVRKGKMLCRRNSRRVNKGGIIRDGTFRFGVVVKSGVDRSETAIILYDSFRFCFKTRISRLSRDYWSMDGIGVREA